MLGFTEAKEERNQRSEGENKRMTEKNTSAREDHRSSIEVAVALPYMACCGLLSG